MEKHPFALAGLVLTLGTAPAMAWAADADTATAQEVVSKVREAAQYLNAKGLAGFADFNNNKDSRWVWKDSYVFVYSCLDDVMIAHPLRPDLVGKPILHYMGTSTFSNHIVVPGIAPDSTRQMFVIELGHHE